jgi:hypothetical protein
VGNGSQVRVGVDAIMGFGRDTFLPNEIIQHLHVIGRCTLKLIHSPDTSAWSQGWRMETNLGLEEIFSQMWDHFLVDLKKALIRLNNSSDELI